MSVTKESDHEEKDRLLPSAICHFRQLSHLLSENSNTKRNYTDSNVACVACGFGRFFFVSKIHFTFATWFVVNLFACQQIFGCLKIGLKYGSARLDLFKHSWTEIRNANAFQRIYIYRGRSTILWSQATLLRRTITALSVMARKSHECCITWQNVQIPWMQPVPLRHSKSPLQAKNGLQVLLLHGKRLNFMTAWRVARTIICRRKMSVRPSVRHTPVLCQHRWTCPHISFYQPTILVFPNQTVWQYSDGGGGGASNAIKGYEKIESRFSTNISLYLQNYAS